MYIHLGTIEHTYLPPQPFQAEIWRDNHFQVEHRKQPQADHLHFQMLTMKELQHLKKLSSN